MEKNVSKNLFWKLCERFGVTTVQFVLQIVLARILSPEHYGVLSIMIVFTTLANVFIQNGFNTALIQNKDVTEEDYSSVFWMTISVSIILYLIIFFCAPLIANFYDMPEIVMPFRVLSLILIPGAFNSIQLAKVSRELKFKKVFISNIGAVLASGIVGIILAYNGAGLWALVAQNLINVFVATFIMLLTVRWFPKLKINFNRLKILFSYGWKLLVSSLLDTLYQDIRSLVIGKKYDEATLGYYNRGKQFPQFIMNAINGSIQSVMLPVIASEQDDKSKVKYLMRTSMTTSAYIIIPIMAGLAAIAAPLVSILLTDKWLLCVPYLQIYCITFAFYPIHTCNLQAINAVGRSDLFLKLELIKKSIGIVALVIAVFCFESPIAIALTGVFTTIISSFINAFPNRKLVNYSFGDQIRDIVPYIFMSLIMFIGAYSITLLNLNNWLLLISQIVVGILLYLIMSLVFKPEPYKILLNTIKLKRGGKKND